MTKEQEELVRSRGLNPKDKVVVWEDKKTLEVKSRRGKRFVIKKPRRT